LRNDDDLLSARSEVDFPSWRTEAQLGNNGTDYSHAFAILRLNELDPSAEYYEVPIGGTAKLLYVERT